MDLLYADSNGKLVVLDAKNGPHAALQPNQAIGYPIIPTSGAQLLTNVPRLGLLKGMTLPPMRVEIVRFDIAPETMLTWLKSLEQAAAASGGTNWVLLALPSVQQVRKMQTLLALHSLTHLMPMLDTGYSEKLPAHAGGSSGP